MFWVPYICTQQTNSDFSKQQTTNNHQLIAKDGKHHFYITVHPNRSKY